MHDTFAVSCVDVLGVVGLKLLYALLLLFDHDPFCVRARRDETRFICKLKIGNILIRSGDPTISNQQAFQVPRLVRKLGVAIKNGGCDCGNPLAGVGLAGEVELRYS